MKLRCILDFKRSRNQRQGSGFLPGKGVIMGLWDGLPLPFSPIAFVL